MQSCQVCKVSLNSQEQYVQHLSGKAHKKKLRAAGLSEDGAGLSEDGGIVPQLDDVNNSQETGEESSNNVSGKKRKSSTQSEAGVCTLCNVIFNSSVQADQHYSGSKHVKRMKIVQGEGETTPDTRTTPDTSGQQPSKGTSGMLYCGFCKIQVNSQEQLDIHRQGTKHKKNLEKLKNVPVTYPGQNFIKTQNPTAIKSEDVPKTLPSFESYLTTSFVKPESTETTMPSLDSYLKG